MIKEIIKYNCHTMDIKEYDKITPEELLNGYRQNEGRNIFLHYQEIECRVVSCKWAAGSFSMIFTIIEPKEN